DRGDPSAQRIAERLPALDDAGDRTRERNRRIPIRSQPELVVDEEVSELARRASGGELLDPRKRRRRPLGEAVEERLCQRFLGRKKLIERADRRARAARDLGHGGSLVALLGEDLRAGVDEGGDALLSPL